MGGSADLGCLGRCHRCPTTIPILNGLTTHETLLTNSPGRRPAGWWLDVLDDVRRGAAVAARLGTLWQVWISSPLSAGLGLWRLPRLRIRPGTRLRLGTTW